MSVWLQVLGHWGPSLNSQTAPPTPPLWQCSFLMRGPPCQELIWNFRAADTDFLSTRRGLPQVWRMLPHLDMLVLITRPQLGLLCSFLRAIHGRLLRWPTTLPLNKQQTKSWTRKESTLRGLPTTRVHLSTDRFVGRESHRKKTALSIEHC